MLTDVGVSPLYLKFYLESKDISSSNKLIIKIDYNLDYFDKIILYHRLFPKFFSKSLLDKCS